VSVLNLQAVLAFYRWRMTKERVAAGKSGAVVVAPI
jgi:hypothetical protein